MKFLVLIITLSVSCITYAQKVTNIASIKTEKDYDNILVEKLDTDTNSTSFIIWIKKGVKSHKHEKHSELIVVIEGTGNMLIGRNKLTINPGDYFRIPQNTFHSLEVTSKKPMKVLSVQTPEFLGVDRVFENNTK